MHLVNSDGPTEIPASEEAVSVPPVTDLPENLEEGQGLTLADLPQFIVVGGDATKGRLGAFDVVTSVLTVESVTTEGRGGIVLILSPEDARALAQGLLHTASGITPMADQVQAWQDAQGLLSSTHTNTEEV